LVKSSRRKFLGNTLKSTAGLLTVSILPLGLTACNNDNKPKDVSSMANLGLLNELEKGEFPKKVNYKVTYKDAWVTQEEEGFVYINKNKDDNTLLIMSPICTHLGCTVPETSEELKQKDVYFQCPCHDGRYDEYGINAGGPPPRPFDVYEAFIQEGNVYISIFDRIERKRS
jgi:menaquinol-cytochrome c reductase iron-sulfur subunit